jgi:hypothetical protein
MALFNILTNEGSWSSDMVGLLTTVAAPDAATALVTVISNDSDWKTKAFELTNQVSAIQRDLAKMVDDRDLVIMASDEVRMDAMAVHGRDLGSSSFTLLLASEVKP